MNEYNIVGLYDHNADSYKKIKEGFKNSNEVAIVHATGTGKSYNAIQYAYDNKNEKIIYVVPYNSIIEHIYEIINNNPNLTMNDFKHVEFRTYTSFVNMSDSELQNLNVDTLVLDEFHHLGAPVWGKKIQTIVDTHPNIKVLGMTAYTVRDRGTSYERDMANPETDELFSNKVVSNYGLCDAFVDGVLPKPIYRSAYINLEKTTEQLEKRIDKLNHDSKDYIELSNLIRDLKKRVHEAPSVAEIFKSSIKPNGKYIYFCPLNPEKGVNDIDTIQKEVKEWLKQMGLTENDYELYSTTSEMGEEGKKNRKAFYNDIDLNNNKANNKLRIMFAINQYNEGTHVPNIDGVIMARATQSDIVFFEQLGRALSVKGRTKEYFDYYQTKSIEELKIICQKRGIHLKDSLDKEDIIELLIAPIVIDLTNNIGFINELENNLKDKIKEVSSKDTRTSRVTHLLNASFDIEMLNQDLYNIVKYTEDRLSRTWEDNYELAKAYYEHYGNLEIPRLFRTINGYEYDENGILLAHWISNQRYAYKKGTLSEDKINLLKEIEMSFEIADRADIWMKKYNLAKAYYEHYGNSEIPVGFRTINGYERDEEGEDIGLWIENQRRRKDSLTEERINLFKAIKMRFENIDRMDIWMQKYNLTKAYYEHHGNLEIPFDFKTINGYERDENGISLGGWLYTQRKAYNEGTLSEEKINLLKALGMRFENIDYMDTWMERYNQAKAYYEYYGNLVIPQGFKTINGYESDENGIDLGAWLLNQRYAYKKGALSEEKINLLKALGMRFESINYMDDWMEKYKLAKAYYEHHGNLKIPQGFNTINGYERDEQGEDLGTWVNKQRSVYKGLKGTSDLKQFEKIKLLEDIGMIWFEEKTDDKLQAQEINDKNISSKNKEIQNRFYSLLNKYDQNTLPNRDDMNNDFIDQLNRKR